MVYERLPQGIKHHELVSRIHREMVRTPLHCRFRNIVVFVQRWASTSILTTCKMVYDEAYGIVIERPILSFSPQIMLDSEGCYCADASQRFLENFLACLTCAYTLLKEGSSSDFDPQMLLEPNSGSVLQSAALSTEYRMNNRECLRDSVSLMMAQFDIASREEQIERRQLLDIVLLKARQLIHAASKGRNTTVQVVHIWTSHHRRSYTQAYRLDALRRFSPIYSTLEPDIEVGVSIEAWLEVNDYQDKLETFMARYNKTPELAALAAEQLDAADLQIGIMSSDVWIRDWMI
jgi:hypothetical protein